MSPRSLLVFWVLCYCKALASDDAGQLVSTAQAAVNLAASNAQAALDRLRQNCAAIPNEESEEDAKGRLDLLTSRLQKLSTNVQQSTPGVGTWVQGMTCFSAMHAQERARVLMKPNVLTKVKPANATVARPLNNTKLAFSPLKTSSNIASIDWRLVNGQSYVAPVRDQGDCGSCYIFSSVAAIESQMMISRIGGILAGAPQKINLAERAYLNCAPNLRNGQKLPADPCDGGWPTEMFPWAASNGLISENQLPYKPLPNWGTWESCAIRPASWPGSVLRGQGFISTVDWWTNMARDGNVRAVQQALQQGPQVIAFNADDKFLSYKGGVFSCNTATTFGGVNHAMLLVGWRPPTGNAQWGTWIIKNSWGTEWGERGYARVTMNPMNDCGVAKVLVARANVNPPPRG